MIQQIPEPVVHTATVGSILAWVASLATAAMPLISAAAGITSIIGGCFAIAWYRKRLKDPVP